MKSTNPIAALFGRSPFKPMQDHMAIVSECVAEVPPLFDALIAGDQAAVVRAKERIFEREQAADALRRRCGCTFRRDSSCRSIGGTC